MYKSAFKKKTRWTSVLQKWCLVHTYIKNLSLISVPLHQQTRSFLISILLFFCISNWSTGPTRQMWVYEFVVLSPVVQICGVPIRRVSRSQLRAVLRPRRPVDAERSAGGHAGFCGNGPSKARADWFLPAAGGQRPAGSQCGAGLVDGHGAVAIQRL